MSWENVADENEYLTFWQPKRPSLCSDLWKESSSVDKNQLQNISCYIFLQLDNAMIYMLYRKSWLKWRVKSGSVEFTLRTLLKVLAVPKSLQSWLKTNKCVWKHCLVCQTKNTEKCQKSRYQNLSQILIYRYFPVYCRGLFATKPIHCNDKNYSKQGIWKDGELY